MKRHQKLLIWFASIALLIAVAYYLPNLFLSGNTLYKLGVHSYKEGNHGDYDDWDKMRRAAFYFEKAISKGYTKRDIYSYLTSCHHSLKDIVNEERIYTLAIAQYPKDAEFHFYRGDCRKTLKNYQGAFNDFDTIIRFTPKYKYINDAYYDRGAMSYILGDTTAANRDRSEVTKRVGSEWRTYDDYWKIWE